MSPIKLLVIACIFAFQLTAQVTPRQERVQDTRTKPFSYIVNIHYKKGFGWFNGTGFFISGKHILTNAHVLKNAKRITITPGANGSDNPFGSSQSVSRIDIPNDFIYWQKFRDI